ncbi:MAG: hypothetical protein CME62_12725 [Halobacteriovoraceae bacterium]|nr:hypothetical protein [Halobacteriovoraceae bacterium]
MKTLKFQVAGAIMGLSLTLAALSPDKVLANDERYLNSEPININGYVQPEVEATDQELETIRGDLQRAENMTHINKKKARTYRELVDQTEKLSESSEEMIEERLEAQKEMAQYNKKIDCMMGRASGPECDRYNKKKRRDEVVQDEVQVAQAAPVVEKNVKPANYGDNFGETIKVLPYTGLTTFDSENENLEANISAGIKVESNINSRFSVGIGFNYTSMTTEDFGSNGSYFGAGYGSGACYTCYNNAYNNFYNGREIQFTNMNFNMYSKFFIVKKNRFRPYVGAGVGYNRSNISYNDNNSFSGAYGYGYGNYNYQFGDEELITSSFNAELMAGSEVIFSDTLGMILEFNYMRGIGGNISSDNGIDPFNAPDQQRLEDLNEELSRANILSLYAGLLVQF